MSFTQDELQAFNAILEQRLSAHRRELERAFDQRMNVLKRDFEQRLAVVQQDLLRSLPQRVSELQSRLKDTVAQKIDKQQSHLADVVRREIGQEQQSQQQQFEGLVERSLAAQLLAIEQLINQHTASLSSEFSTAYTVEGQPDFDAIEVQTEIPWDDLVDVVDKAMDQRLLAFSESLQTMLQAMEQYITVQLQTLREELIQGQALSGNITNIQDVFASIEQLEHVIESMQVAMNANHALLSNRLYHHQNLPLERAHPRATAPSPSTLHVNGLNNFPPLLKGRIGEPQQE